MLLRHEGNRTQSLHPKLETTSGYHLAPQGKPRRQQYESKTQHHEKLQRRRLRHQGNRTQSLHPKLETTSGYHLAPQGKPRRQVIP
ncbi:hypothetical protein CDAR_100831 [Caerostris darwini]|uniref:Uncharacterized protein n=1 Tax=Caerostris darwini TaxID=1538125 RepID=A0AAV4VWC0_9ARAC|nr:hypothetical protein CDAR_100831 [Caerostris darwini]